MNVVKHWAILTRKLESLPLEVFKNEQGMAPDKLM